MVDKTHKSTCETVFSEPALKELLGVEGPHGLSLLEALESMSTAVAAPMPNWDPFLKWSQVEWCIYGADPASNGLERPVSTDALAQVSGYSYN